MHTNLADWLGYMEWADAEQWRALAAAPQGARSDAVREVMGHVVLVQEAFLMLWQGAVMPPFPSGEGTFDELRARQRTWHGEVRAAWVPAPADAAERRVVPMWFDEPRPLLTFEELATQLVLHTQHHRGQVARAIREGGGEPPDADFIVWVWKGRPGADWTVD